MEAERLQPERPPAEQRSTPRPSLGQEMRTCQIERWRGYVTSRFFVLDGDGLFLESKAFRWRHASPPPETKSARAAYDELVTRLEAEGWTLLAEGAPWFASTFARDLVPSEAPAAFAPEHRPVPVVVASPSVLQSREEEVEIAEPER
jgi:hypothetical protein